LHKFLKSMMLVTKLYKDIWWKGWKVLGGLIGWFICGSFHSNLVYLGCVLHYYTWGGQLRIHLGVFSIMFIDWEKI
jgi:hypothetical protein